MILIFCGMPASGKSTIAHIIKERLGNVKTIVSDDIARDRYSRIITMVDEQIDSHHYIIVDATYYKRAWREELLKVIGSRDEVKLVYVHCSLETCLRRNREREDAIPERAVYIIWNKFEEPENPDISVNTDQKTPEEAAEIILKYIQA
jgi:tRNA uridine 5-carbamoylmethylation protein Kti12